VSGHSDLEITRRIRKRRRNAGNASRWRRCLFL